MSDATATGFPVTFAETGERPPRPITGPVLMGDILNSRGDRPELLRLWADWERQAREEPAHSNYTNRGPKGPRLAPRD